MKKGPRKLTLTKGRTSFFNKEKITECKSCSYSHFRGNWLAYNQIYNTCKKRNHFAKMCPSNKHVKEIIQNDFDSPASEQEQTYVGCITPKTLSTTQTKIYEVNSTSEDWFVTLVVNGTKTRFKNGSGSQVDIIPKKEYQLLKNKTGLKRTRTRLTAYNGTFIPALGKCAVQILQKNITFDVPRIVADTDTSSILGLKTSTDMHLKKNPRARGVMVLVVGNEHGETSSNPGRD